MSSDVLISLLAVFYDRDRCRFRHRADGRVAEARNEPEHSSFSKQLDEAQRANRPGIER